MISIVVAASGGGRSLQNFIDHKKQIKVVGLIVSNKTCGALQIAKDNNIPTFEFKGGLNSPQIDQLKIWLDQLQPDLICLAGYLKIFPVIEKWKKRTLNIHPSLLPKFGGKGMYGDNVHRAVLGQAQTLTGASVHLVTDEYDKGTLIAQSSVKVLKNDTISSLSQRVFSSECLLYPEAIRSYHELGYVAPSTPKIYNFE